MTPHISRFASNNGKTINWIALINNEVVGHIYLGVEPDNKIKFFNAWVSENHRRKGIYRLLWETRWEYVKDNFKGYKAYAWCLPKSLPLLVEKGFTEGDTAVYVEREVG